MPKKKSIRDVLSRKSNINVIHAILILYWTTFILNTDSYKSVYLIICIAALYAVFQLESFVASKRDRVITILFSAVLSLASTLANYSICLAYESNLVNIALFAALFITGTLSFYYVLVLAASKMENLNKSWFSLTKGNNYKSVFWHTFLFVTVVDILVLFLSEYPAVLTRDSINQLSQIADGVYSNHHPFWHTMLIKVFYNFGLSVFKNANAAIATYSVFQLIVMALIVAFANMTLSELGTKKIVNIVFCLYFALMPFHFLYSITIWKDILFGGMLLLFVTCLARILNNMRCTIINYAILTISCLGFGLLRSNGWYALALTTLLYVGLLMRKNKKVLIVLVLVLGCTYAMEHPLLKVLNVSQPDIIESLSIPAQQIARTVYDGKQLDAQDIDMLNQIIDVSEIPNTYEWYISDPVKDLVRESNNQDYLKENIKDYTKLYIKIGLRYPIEYGKAWIDQTKGYFNGGYDYWFVRQGVLNNNLDISHNKTTVSELVGSYVSLFTKIGFLNPLVSIGLHVWMIVMCFYIGMLKKDKLIILLPIPLLAIILSLLIATPVYSEFRYAYAIFTSAMFVIVSTVKHAGKSTSQGKTF